MIYDLKKLFFSLLLILGLEGCSSEDVTDLQQWTDEVLARPGGRIEPLPEIKPYEAYTYQGLTEAKRNPFEPFYKIREPELKDVVDTGLSQEMESEIRNRNREELEQFELDSLRMAGTMENQGENWGVILDPDGVVHRVKTGNYMGRNIGKIINIFEDSIQIREIIKNSQGRWEEREAAIALVED